MMQVPRGPTLMTRYLVEAFTIGLQTNIPEHSRGRRLASKGPVKLRFWTQIKYVDVWRHKEGTQEAAWQHGRVDPNSDGPGMTGTGRGSRALTQPARQHAQRLTNQPALAGTAALTRRRRANTPSQKWESLKAVSEGLGRVRGEMRN